jgi:hypothetical protein
MTKNKRVNFGRSLPEVFFLVFLALSFLFLRGSVKFAQGTASDNVAGYAWSSNYGWISMNCTNNNSCGAGHDYGVNIYPATAGVNAFNFVGYAWSPNIGWISFQDPNPPDAYAFSSNCKVPANCSSGNCSACYNPDTGKIYGWAKALSLGDDGWINLGPVATSPGVSVDRTVASGTFSGFGWGGNSSHSIGLGWLSFNCSNTGSCGSSNYSVYLRNHSLPTPTGLSAPNWPFNLACNQPALSANLEWNNIGYNASAYEIILNTSNTTTSPAYDTGKRSAINAVSFVVSSTNPAMNGRYDRQVYWWLKVWDDFGFVSNWHQFDTTKGDVVTDNAARNISQSVNPTKTFTTWLHEMPLADFSYIPAVPQAYYPVTTTDISYFFTTSNPNSNQQKCSSTKCTWLWKGSSTISNLTPTASSTVMTFGFTKAASAKINMTVTDPDGYFCSSTTLPFYVDLLPVWREKQAQ